jgi:hypothetical protein
MSENKQDLIKQRLEDHTKMMAEKFEDILNRTVVLKSLDLVALEALRLNIPNWETMKLGELRAEIKQRQDLEKVKS